MRNSSNKSGERRAAADGLLNFQCCNGEVGEAPREIRSGLIEMIWRAVVEKIPDDLETIFFRRLERRKPARPVVSARCLLDEVPAETIAKGPEPKFPT